MQNESLTPEFSGFELIQHGLDACPTTTRLVDSIINMTKAPADIALLGSLTSYSTLLQGIIDVEKIHGGSGPVSINALVRAEPGERKTTVSSLLNKPILEFEKEERENQVERKANYEIEKEIADFKLKGLKKRLLDALTLGKEELSCKLKEQTVKAKKNYPTEPHPLTFIYEDITPEAIVYELSKGWRNASLMSNEGGGILLGRAIQKFPMLNNLWSGEPCPVYRRSSASFHVTDGRLTVFIAAQSIVIEKFTKNRGAEAKGTGLLGRFLIGFPDSTQGTRWLGPEPENVADGYEEYLKQSREILEEVLERHKKNIKRDVIGWTESAKLHSIAIHNYIESQLAPGGKFHNCVDHGNKLFENITRVAALLTYIELGPNNQITLDILRDAAKIVFHFSNTYRAYFSTPSQFEVECEEIEKYIERQKHDGNRYISKNGFQRSGPNKTRAKSNTERVLAKLVNMQKVQVYRVNRTGLVFVDLYPERAPDYSMFKLFLHKCQISEQTANELYSESYAPYFPQDDGCL